MNFLTELGIPLMQLTLPEILLNIVVAFILGIAVALVNRFTSRGRAVSGSFHQTLVILAMVVALVMMVIGNSVARAFSLVGALSIIRFRTVVKENRDIAYVFLALAAGMAAGVGNHAVSIFGVGLILLLLLILDFIRFGMAPSGVYLLRFQRIPEDTEKDDVHIALESIAASYSHLAVKTVKMGQFVEHSFLIRLKKGVSEQKAISQISMLEGMERVTLLAEESETEA
jgi:uncharacterized membrane protein YhiD involved in acid resistance